MRHSKDDSSIQAGDAFKALLANIRFHSDEGSVKTIVVTSSVPGEGKTTVSMELAESMASSGKRTLLVEANLRGPALANLIAGDTSGRRLAGYCDVVEGRVPLPKAIYRLKAPHLYFMDSGRPDSDPADVFADGRMVELVGRLRDEFDYVVFDTPAIVPYVDAAVLAHVADGTILVMRPNLPLAPELVAANEELKKAKANVLGICENDFPTH